MGYHTRYATRVGGRTGFAPLPPAPIFVPHRQWAGWISQQIGRKVQLGRFPQGTTGPRVCYSVIHEDTPMYTDGPCRLSEVTVQIDAFAEDPDNPALIQRAILEAMGGYRGAVGLAWLDSAISGSTISPFVPAPQGTGGGTWRETRTWDL